MQAHLTHEHLNFMFIGFQHEIVLLHTQISHPPGGCRSQYLAQQATTAVEAKHGEGNKKAVLIPLVFAVLDVLGCLVAILCAALRLLTVCCAQE